MLTVIVLIIMAIITYIIQPRFTFHVVAIMLMLFFLSEPANAVPNECPKFTSEQHNLIRLSYMVGSQHDDTVKSITGGHLGHTVAAIIWKESFIGNNVIRFSNDPSFGIGQMKITTLFWLNGIDYTYANRDYHEHKMMSDLLTNDLYAITQTYNYIKMLLIRHESVYMARMRYNGSGSAARAYSFDINDRVQLLIACKLV